MILSSFTFIFTSVFQSNIELWIHFFLCVLWTKSVASVKEMFFKRKDSLWRQKKNKSFFILQKSFSDQKTSSPTKHRDDARPFVNTSKLVLPKHCFICRTRWQKHFFNSWKNESWLFLIFFLNGWWNVHPWNRFHGWTLHWRFTKEESVAWTYTTKESFPLSSELYTVQYTA